MQSGKPILNEANFTNGTSSSSTANGDLGIGYLEENGGSTSSFSRMSQGQNHTAVNNKTVNGSSTAVIQWKVSFLVAYLHCLLPQ